MTVLDEILTRKRKEVATAALARPLDAVKARAYVQPPARSFGACLRARPGESARLIAEIKRRSPSVGTMAEIANPVELARTYAANGARAISVLTDFHHFGGTLDDLRAVRATVDLPVLRKDFLFTEYQLWEARAAGADAVLLIVAALASPKGDPDELHTDPPASAPDHEVARNRISRLMRVARKAGLEVLLEVHDEAEAVVACDLRAPIIGINNRNLANFVTSVETTEQVIASMNPRLGYAPVLVSESGLHDATAVSRVRRAGAHAVLVGEALVRSGDVAAKVREMSGVLGS
jgi:indole-3-glycerol phosphate synthase